MSRQSIPERGFSANHSQAAHGAVVRTSIPERGFSANHSMRASVRATVTSIPERGFYSPVRPSTFSWADRNVCCTLCEADIPVCPCCVDGDRLSAGRISPHDHRLTPPPFRPVFGFRVAVVLNFFGRAAGLGWGASPGSCGFAHGPGDKNFSYFVGFCFSAPPAGKPARRKAAASYRTPRRAMRARPGFSPPSIPSTLSISSIPSVRGLVLRGGVRP